jgi:DNA-directed RNA polymerase III subunit RPC1
LASEIIDVNTKMKACLRDGAQTTLLMEFWDFLQLQCAMYITSDLPGIPSHLQIVNLYFQTHSLEFEQN